MDFNTGDVGGILGLLLGCSVLSVFELVDFFIYNCLRKMHHGGSNKTWDCNGTKNDKLDKSPKVSLSPSVISNAQKPGFFDGSAYYGIDFANVWRVASGSLVVRFEVLHWPNAWKGNSPFSKLPSTEYGVRLITSLENFKKRSCQNCVFLAATLESALWTN